MKILKIIICLCIASPVVAVDSSSQSYQLRQEIKGSTSGRGKDYSQAYANAMRTVPRGSTVTRVVDHNLGDNGYVVYIYWSKKI
jgi:hypothetical protein